MLTVHFRFLNNRLVGQVCIGLHRLLLEHQVQLSASLLDPHGRPTKMTLQVSVAYSGPGQHHDKMLSMSRDSSDEVDDDRRALLNLEQNIANIERSMSASQLGQAQYKLQGSKVRLRPSKVLTGHFIQLFWGPMLEIDAICWILS